MIIKIILIILISFLLAILNLWLDTKLKKKKKGDEDD